MSTEAVVRDAAPGDAEIIHRLAHRIWHRHYPGIIPLAQIDYMLGQRYAPDHLRTEMRDPSIRWRMVEIDGEAVGFASTHRLPPDALKLDKLYVDPDRHRAGIGRRLVEAVFAEARALGCREVVLAVNRFNVIAISAYQRLGFAIREARKTDIGEGFVMDDFIMVATLEPAGGGTGAMKLRFTKMQGLGNDFVVVDGIRQSVALTPDRVRRIADRHFGIGCDQLLLVEKPQLPDADFRYRIFNADGGEVEQCGNGARCFVRFVHAQGLTDKTEIAVETLRGVIRPRLQEDGEVSVDMGVPRFAPDEIPFRIDDGQPDAVVHPLLVGDIRVPVSVVSMGNPHAVLVVDDVERAPVSELGPAIERHPRFPQRVNVGFLQVLDRGRVRLRVYERGAGETLACGTGACAAAVAGIRRGLLDSPVVVETRGGPLRIEWSGEGASLIMTGPAETVFEGEIDLGEQNE